MLPKAMFELHGEFASYLAANGVNETADDYIWWMNAISKRLGRRIGPSELFDEACVQKLLAEVQSLDENSPSKPLISNPGSRRNLRSILRKYANMVRELRLNQLEVATPATNTRAAGVFVFGDRSETNAHDQFQTWRKKHPAGFFLNLKTSTTAVLHTNHCHHPGDADWKEEIGQSLGNTQKICAESVTQLEAWARTKGVVVARCKDCAPDLQQEMLNIYRRMGKELGYWSNYYLREIRRKGGLATAKRTLGAHQASDIAKGFQAVLDAGRVELLVETVALKPEFQGLFTEAELAEAQRRQSLLPEYSKPKPVDAEQVFPDELPNASDFPEGAKKQVVVNVYERNPKAREACIAKHGRRCAVCGMSFADRYGEYAKQLIHVHHKKPIAGRRCEYKLDPVKDLVPVCPNCHAVLHLQDPPMAVEELKMLYQQRKAATA